MSHFVLAMVQHPEVLQRAQAEIDRLVGPDRLPTFEDRGNLPYGTISFYLIRYEADDAHVSGCARQ